MSDPSVFDNRRHKAVPALDPQPSDQLKSGQRLSAQNRPREGAGDVRLIYSAIGVYQLSQPRVLIAQLPRPPLCRAPRNYEIILSGARFRGERSPQCCVGFL